MGQVAQVTWRDLMLDSRSIASSFIANPSSVHMNIVHGLVHHKSLCSYCTVVRQYPAGIFKSSRRGDSDFFSSWSVVHSRHTEHFHFWPWSIGFTNVSLFFQDTLTVCWAFEADDRPTFSTLLKTLERLPKIRQRLHRSPSQPCTVGRAAEALIWSE